MASRNDKWLEKQYADKKSTDPVVQVLARTGGGWLVTVKSGEYGKTWEQKADTVKEVQEHLEEAAKYREKAHKELRS